MNHLVRFTPAFFVCSFASVFLLNPLPVAVAGTLDGAEAAGNDSVAIGADARADSNDSVSIGSNSFTFSPFSVAIGSTSNANKVHTTAIGAAALADQPQSTALGSFAQAFGQEALATGSNAYAEGHGASALGAATFVEAAGATGVGYQAEVSAGADGAVALGSHSLADEANTVSVGNSDTGLTRRITNVAPAIADHDAVNFSQFRSGLGGVQQDAFAGIAAAASFNPAVPTSAGKTAVAVGVATYRGEQAVSFSFGHRLSGSSYNTSLSGGVAYDSSHHALGKVGVAWEF